VEADRLNLDWRVRDGLVRQQRGEAGERGREGADGEELALFQGLDRERDRGGA
jgi:hypothetical protein